MYTPRAAESELRELAIQFKSVAVVGPRQSGKTTLVRMVFPDLQRRLSIKQCDAVMELPILRRKQFRIKVPIQPSGP